VGGACVGPVAATSVPILVVMPSYDTPIIGGETFAVDTLPGTLGIINPSTAPLCMKAGIGCVPLSPLTSVTSGTLEVTSGFGKAVWPPGLLPNQPGATATLPVTTTFHPMWIDPASGSPMLASKLGLPLQDVAATQDQVLNQPPEPTLADSGGPSYAFKALLPQPYGPSDPSQWYQMQVVPNSPFDVFPPYMTSLPFTLGNATLLAFTATLSPVTYNSYPLPGTPIRPRPSNYPITAYEVQSLPGAPVLAGWTMYINNSDGQRISGIVTLADAAVQDLVIYDATNTDDQSGETLIVAPPPGVDLPQLNYRPTGTAFQPPFVYPALPPTVMFSGFVRRNDNLEGTTGQVVMVADGTPSVAPTAYVGSDSSTALTQLLYVTTLTTTSSVGDVSGQVPAGSYRTYVIPDDASLALTMQTTVLTPSGGPQTGKGFYANPRTHVTGRVVLPNGTPLYAAQVVIDPSADSPLLAIPDDPRMRPRETRGMTDINGAFDILSDSGAVDISVQPQAGTNFPWIVLTNRTVPPTVLGDAGGPTSLALSDIVVPLPAPYPPSGQTGFLVDSTGVPIPRALIRAYQFPQLSSPPDGGTPPSRGARLIGMTLSDDTGAFQLFTTPPN
jgi:hypothetical protein